MSGHDFIIEFIVISNIIFLNEFLIPPKLIARNRRSATKKMHFRKSGNLLREEITNVTLPNEFRLANLVSFLIL